MKERSFSIFLSFIISIAAFGQKNHVSLGVGPVLGFPVSNNNFSYYYKNGIGGSLLVNVETSKLGSLIFDLTLLSIGAKQPPVTKTSLTLIKTGYRTNFSNSQFFLAADLGFAKYGSYKTIKGYFVIGGTAGYSFPVFHSSFIDLFPTFNYIVSTPSNTIWLTVNLLYRFDLKKVKSKSSLQTGN